ncbi:ETC complex I subunit [Sphingomonas panacisoli]|uniref:ETC complex I subunit n=1 Tax=Sphingomonas panacisoli TaxID=1813879 RepID=A0A5B8LE80_9SPHN|nr:ETC complex I subunit [Sphingomonas panacisoli]QDZ06219.1 ETC complex I subunit [Sphingomonas panacisoli]
MAKARIFQRPKNAMQSGRARTDRWTLEFEPAEAKRPDPLTGWAGSGDTNEQVRLGFATAEDAIAYAEKVGLAFEVVPTPTRTLKIQTYADNFR